MQISFFSGKNEFKIDKPIRLIELFAGIGSQAKALKNIGANFEHYKIVEFDKYAVKSYNAIYNTNFETSDITKITATDLQIVDTEKYCYVMTYSFPCQDLSKAGKQNGMSRDSGTRSGLLWEVERLLDECDNLPQVLLMENVPDVIGTKNIHNFAEWIAKLEKLGYKNYWQCLNAKNYGVAQNRDRCFMVSILGDYYYEFPQPVKLEKRLKDYLEENVDEKFYLSETMINGFVAHKERHELLGNGFGWKPTNGDCIASTVKTTAGSRPDDNYLIIAGQIEHSGLTEMTGRVYQTNGISPTIRTMQGGNLEPKIMIGAFRGRNPDNPSDRMAGSPTEQRLEINSQGLCNTLTTVQKDNVLVEPKIIDPQGRRTKYELQEIKQHNICPTLRAQIHGNPPQVITADGFMVNQSDSYNAGALKDCARTLQALNPNGAVVINNYHIRKLTPLECFRLMGFSDNNFYAAQKVNSNSQLYKQAGNSIVVDVLVHIFKEML